MLGRRWGKPRWADNPVVDVAKDESRGGGTSYSRSGGWGANYVTIIDGAYF